MARICAILPTMLLAGLLAGGFASTPAGSTRDEPSVQLTVTTVR